jgi:hypothetical protein
MQKLNVKMLLAVASTAALLAACGGNNDDQVAAPVDPSTQTGQSVQKTLDYITSLIAGSSENSDEVNVNAITLAVDDTAEPSAI